MAEDAPVPAPDAETYSKEMVDSLKAELAKKNEETAGLKARFAAHESRQREQLKEMQPVVSEFVDDAMKDAGDFKHEMAPMASFAAGLDKAENVESAMPLARTISVFSAKLKREREQFSVKSATAEQLGAANKQIDELTAERDTKASRISELETLCNERQAAAEKLQEQLAKAGVITEKFDFSRANAREAAPAASTGAPLAVAAASSSAPAVDPLLAYVTQAGVGTSKIGLSSTSHHILGAGAGEQSIHTALRTA
jgi:hypothetical protein